MTPRKLRSLDECRQLVRAEYGAGRRTVLASGCFDLIHPGHVLYLEEARALGDLLVVALNSDASVQSLKGPTRPIYNEQARACVLSALECVAHVVLFGERRVTQVLESLRPDVWVKGSDYSLETLDQSERIAAQSLGIDIRFVQLLDDYSTTATIKSLREA